MSLPVHSRFPARLKGRRGDGRMEGQMDPDALRVHSWASLCQLCDSHSRRMTRLCKFVVARELIATTSHRFTSQTPPDTIEELRIRRMQETHVASIIGSMVHADGMARKWSSVADQI